MRNWQTAENVFLEEASDLSGDVRAGLEEEIRQYEAYAAQDGQRRREVEALTNLSRDRILWIRDVIDMAEAVMEYISSWSRRMRTMSWTRMPYGSR